MAKPVVVTIPHALGREEAARRIKAGVGNLRNAFGTKMSIVEETWVGDHLDFRVAVLGQSVAGNIDIAEDNVRLEVQLPWMLSILAEKAKAMIGQRGRLMLDKK